MLVLLACHVLLCNRKQVVVRQLVEQVIIKAQVRIANVANSTVYIRLMVCFISMFHAVNISTIC